MDKKCEYCGVEFSAKRATAKYCSDSHKVLAFYSRRIGGPSLASKNCDASSSRQHTPRTAESIVNEQLGALLSEFCKANNCKWGDIKEAYLASLKPPKPDKKEEKSEKASSSVYDRRKIKLGI